jgi:hypothetical protein
MMPITPARLRALLKRDVIKPASGLNLPGSRGLAALADALSRQQDLHHPSLGDVRQACFDCYIALDKLESELLNYSKACQVAAGRSDVPAAIRNKLLEYAALAKEAAEEHIQYFVFEATMDIDPTKRWHFRARHLYRDFARAMEPANPGYTLGADVAARFIAAVVPLITGERPKASSVAVFLKQNKYLLAEPALTGG